MTTIKTEVTQLVLHSLPDAETPMPEHAGRLDLLRVRTIPLAFYRYLYRVGRPHHWTSRCLGDRELAREVHAPNVRLQVLYCDGAPAGWFELDVGRAPRQTRLVHFATMPEFRGRGLARYLLSKAITAGFEDGPNGLVVETNTLDHPAALPLYRKMGFRPLSVREVVTIAFTDPEADGDGLSEPSGRFAPGMA
ncbi:GNAT family N-acetyltransferase [Aureimonas sp. OT7]|uniref:GNAT family N-acetyltransferase n=1 Tax=Aureimonas sp. OT7 TaxID=2816454 RepID=UPI00177CB3D6|nr:GNAT family N-acetyltransferase [Aureimonas sp. OT7]QOG05676.1 GNAT family N-acetyltransferase [Aureimonas sp. OT7]